MTIYFEDNKKNYRLYHGDCLQILPQLHEKNFNMIFADPPYFLSNGGLTVKNGYIQSVDKGEWDKFSDDNQVYIFTYEWLNEARRLLKDNGTIWISGTHHNIFMIGRILNQLNFKILNMITWEKPNPPPNFSCRYFTNSAEWIIWARKDAKIPHYFNYELMKKLNNDKQMKDIWRLPSVSQWEKRQGRHPTQKPLGLLSRIILASTQKGDNILDPFAGSATAGIAAALFERNFIGIEQQIEFLQLARARYLGLDEDTIGVMKNNIKQQIMK